MPPGNLGHYRQNNISNPFNNFPTNHVQPSHYAAGQHNAFQSNAAAGTTNGFAPGAYSNGGQAFGSMLNNGAGLTNNFGGPAGALASQEAQMGFARGAAMQQQQQAAQDMGAASRGNGIMSGGRIREVWKGNLAQEMALIRTLIDKYPFVSMDTEFPGVVARPMGNFPSKADYHYQTLRCNVDLLKLIQLGITLFTVDGDVPPPHLEEAPVGRSFGTYGSNALIQCPCTWTFNFDFSLEADMYSADSIEMLKKAGVDFDKNATQGIDPMEFGSLLTTSGLVLEPSVSWLSFHSGYDFGYLVKIMSQEALPSNEEQYLERIRIWFPRIYDIKYLFRHIHEKARRGVLGQQASAFIQALGQKSGLQDIADELGCVREGKAHTAGSDAWLTGQVFWRIRQKLFDGEVPEDLIGMIWGLNGVGPPASAATQHAAITGHHTPATNGAKLYNGELTPNTHRADGPPTPQTNTSGATSNTPGPHGGFSGMGGLTGGVFSSFQQGHSGPQALIRQTPSQTHQRHRYSSSGPTHTSGPTGRSYTHTQRPQSQNDLTSSGTSLQESHPSPAGGAEGFPHHAALTTGLAQDLLDLKNRRSSVGLDRRHWGQPASRSQEDPRLKVLSQYTFDAPDPGSPACPYVFPSNDLLDSQVCKPLGASLEVAIRHAGGGDSPRRAPRPLRPFQDVPQHPSDFGHGRDPQTPRASSQPMTFSSHAEVGRCKETTSFRVTPRRGSLYNSPGCTIPRVSSGGSPLPLPRPRSLSNLHSGGSAHTEQAQWGQESCNSRKFNSARGPPPSSVARPTGLRGNSSQTMDRMFLG